MSGYADALAFLQRQARPSGPTQVSSPALEAQRIDFETALPEMTPEAAPLDDSLAFPQDVENSLAPLEEDNAAAEAPQQTTMSRGYSDALDLINRQAQQQAATQQAVAEATTPDDRLPIISPDLADALGVLDYRDPQEGQRRQQAAAMGEILGLPEYEKVQLGAAPVNTDGTVTIRRAQAVSPEANAAAAAKLANMRTMAAGEMLVEESPKEVGTLQGIANAAQNAFDSARQALMATNGLDANDASEIARIEYNKAARRVAPGYAAYQQAEGWDAAAAFAKNPFEVTANIITEGLAGSWPALASGLATGGTTALVTGAAGSVVPGVGNVIGTGGGFTAGMVGGTAAGSFATEYGGKILEELQTAGMNPKDPESIANFFSNETLMAQAKDAALKRGVPVAAFDALSAGIAGRVGSVFRAAAKTPVRLAVTEGAIQGGLGGAGEVAGSVAAGDPVNPKAVFGEVIGEVGPAAIEIAAGRQAAAAAAEVPQNFTPISTPAAAPATTRPRSLGEVRAPQIAVDQAAIDEAFGSPFAPPAVNPQVNPAEVSDDTFAPPANEIPPAASARVASAPLAPEPTGSPELASGEGASIPTPPRPAYSFSTDAITPEQTALAADFSARLTSQLGTQGVIDSGSSLTLTPVNLDRVDAGAGLSDFIDTFSRLTETRIQFVKPSDPTIFGGAVRSDDAKTIFLNAESQRPVAALIGHEWGHSLQYTQPALYKDLRRVVATYTDDYRARARESAASPIYRSGSASQRARTQAAELTNNTLGDAFLDPSFWESVRNENKPLVQKLWTSFNEWVDSLLNRQSQSTFGTPQFATDLAALRRDLAKTIAPALRGMENANATEQSILAFSAEQSTNQPMPEDQRAAKTSGQPSRGGSDAMGQTISEDFPISGKPFEFFSIRNTEKSPFLGSQFGQDIEPHGKYMSQSNPRAAQNLDARFEKGLVRFETPLVINFGGEYGDPSNWKNVISKQFNGKTGVELSQAIRNAGYDGIVTVEPAKGPNRPAQTSEIIDIRSLQPLPGSRVGKVDEATGLPLNDDGTVTVYHGTTSDRSKQIREQNVIRSAAEPDVYFTTAKEGTGYGDGTVVAVRIDPSKLELDDEFPDGRKDFRVSVGRSKSLKVSIENPDSPAPATGADPAPTVIPSISFAAENRYKPTDIILSPAGHQDWGVFTDLDEVRAKGKIKSLPIRILKGKHFGPNKGYGIEHIRAEHEQDFAAFQEPLENVLHRLLLDFNEVYLQPDGRLALLSRRPTMVSVVELREEKGGFYSVVTGFPKENPSWKPAGARILDGRRAAFAQSARAPGPTAQGNTGPNPPLEPLPGKYSVEYAMSLRRPVNKNIDSNISAAAEPKPRKFTQSVQAAEGVMPEVKAQLNSFEYDPVSNAETVAAARAGIDAAGSIDAAFTGLMGKTAAPEWQPTAVDYATGIELLGQLQNRGRHEDAGAIANMMATRATDQGRAIQALSMISRLGPQGIEVFAQKQLQNAAVNGRNEKEKAQIQTKLDEAAQLRVEMDKVRHGATTAAIVGRRAEIKSALPAGADPVATNMAIRDAIMASPTPLAAEAATASILTGQGVSETGATRISKSIVRDFLKTSQDARAQVLQDLQTAAQNDRRLNKGKLGDLLRLNREGKLADTGLHAGMAKMLGIPHWSREHSMKVQRIIKERERATDPRIKLVKGAEILDVVYREFMPPDIASKIDTFQTILMLLNTKTIGRNVLGNTFAFAADLAADAVAIPMDALVSLGTGKRERVGISLGEGLMGLGAGFADVKAGYKFARSEGRSVIPSLAEGVNTLVRLGRLQSSGKYDSAEINRYSGGVFSMPGLRHLETTLGAVLSIADRGFYESAFRRSLDNRMKAARANGTPMLAPDKDMVDAARMDAARGIYQNETPTGELLSKMRKALNYFTSFRTTTRWGLGSMIFKFTTTPSSILHRALDFSPIGFINSSYELLAPMLSKNKEFDQKAFVDAFSQALVGTTGLVALGYWLSHLGIISAGSSADDEKKRNLEKARGWGNYKINVDALKRALMTGNFWTRQLQYLGDRTETYDWAQPLSIAVAMGAYAQENQTAVRDGLLRGKKQNIFDTGVEWLLAASGAATGAMNSLMEQPLLSGLNTFFKNASYDGLPGAIMETAVAIPGSFIPTAARQWMQLTDNSVRETRDSSDFREYINKLKAQLPGLSKTLPQKYDIAGQPVERWARDSNTIFNVMFNPGMTTYIKGSPVLTEMSRVFEMTANPSAVPNQVSRDFTLEGVKVRLTDEEISAMQKDMGALSVAAVEKFVLEDPRYAKATWDIKAKAFTRALEKAAEAAKYRVLLSRPDLKTRAAAEHRKILQDQAAESKRRAEEFAAMGQLQPGP